MKFLLVKINKYTFENFIFYIYIYIDVQRKILYKYTIYF